MSGRRGRRPVLICLIVLCLACVALMTKAVISFVSFSPRYDPVADEPEVLFDLNASDYGERMRIVPLSGDAERSTLHEPGSSVTYVGMSDGASSVIVALDAATAEVRWDARLTDSRPRCVPYGPELRCSTGGELVGISESDGTTTVLTALPSDDYRVSKNQEERITYLLPPVDGRSQDYQVMWIDERDRVVILPWSPPPTPCAEASGTSFKDVDPHTGVGDHDLLAAVVVDGWMVLSAVDTGGDRRPALRRSSGEDWRERPAAVGRRGVRVGVESGGRVLPSSSSNSLQRGPASGGEGADVSARGRSEAGPLEKWGAHSMVRHSGRRVRGMA